VHIATKLNRSHLMHGRKALILPTLGRTEIDLQNGVPQGVTVEDSMSMVHISYGMNKPASPDLLSETAIVRAWPRPRWAAHKWTGRRTATTTPHPRRYRKGVRRLPRLQRTRGQAGRLPPAVASREREWKTPAATQFVPHRIDLDTPIRRARASTASADGADDHALARPVQHHHLRLDDRYRGVFGMRRVVFINSKTSTCWA
jgi:hypothetical protein